MRSLQEHNATFDFESFHLRSRKIAARERLCERAREALNAVPLYPCIMCFDAEVPSYIELTGFDIPDQRIGRPIALIRFTDVVRCVEGRGSWLRILQSGFPGGVWVFNEKHRYPEVLIPLVVGKPPGNPCEPGEKVLALDAHVRPKPKVRGKKKTKRLRPVMIWYNNDEFETWFRLEPRLPRGAVLKIRQKPDDDAQVVGGLSQGYAIKAVCSTGDWVMVAYMAPAPKGGVDEEGEVKMMVKEGWMVFLSPLRVLLVPVTDPQALYALEGKESPAELPPTPSLDEDDSSEEEEVTEEQKKVLRMVARDAKKQRKVSARLLLITLQCVSDSSFLYLRVFTEG